MAGNANSGGRNAKTPEQHRTDGTYRPDRHGGFESPEPTAGRPEPPGTLNAIARAEWDRMLDALEARRSLSKDDYASVYQYVELFAEAERVKAASVEVEQKITLLDKLLKKITDVHVLIELMERIENLYKIRVKHANQIRQGRLAATRLLVELGMTPAARSRVRIPKTGERKQSKLALFRGKAAGM